MTSSTLRWFATKIKYEQSSCDIVLTCETLQFPCHSYIVALSEVIRKQMLVKNHDVSGISCTLFTIFWKNIYLFVSEQINWNVDMLELYVASRKLECPLIYQDIYSKIQIDYGSAITIFSCLYDEDMENDRLFHDTMNFLHEHLDTYIDDKISKFWLMNEDLRISCLVSFQQNLRPQKWLKSHSNILLDHLIYLRKTGDFSDMVLTCKNGEIPCHRLILEAESTVFIENSFFDVDVGAIVLYLDWLYCGNLVRSLNPDITRDFETLVLTVGSNVILHEEKEVEMESGDGDMGLTGLFNQ
jgi:hypothetical protein